jgi:hypothetical protein
MTIPWIDCKDRLPLTWSRGYSDLVVVLTDGDRKVAIGRLWAPRFLAPPFDRDVAQWQVWWNDAPAGTAWGASRLFVVDLPRIEKWIPLGFPPIAPVGDAERHPNRAGGA